MILPGYRSLRRKNAEGGKSPIPRERVIAIQSCAPVFVWINQMFLKVSNRPSDKFNQNAC
jgi:hypothetical protein